MEKDFQIGKLIRSLGLLDLFLSCLGLPVHFGTLSYLIYHANSNANFHVLSTNIYAQIIFWTMVCITTVTRFLLVCYAFRLVQVDIELFDIRKRLKSWYHLNIFWLFICVLQINIVSAVYNFCILREGRVLRAILDLHISHVHRPASVRNGVA